MVSKRVNRNHVVDNTVIHITACGSFALEVPNRKFRSASFVSSEKVYKRASEDYIAMSANESHNDIVTYHILGG